MADSNTASSLPGPDAGGNQPNLNVVPDAPPVEHRGRQNKAVAEVLSYAGEICVAAKLPQFAPELFKRGIKTPFIDALEADIALAGNKTAAALQCDAARKDATQAEGQAEKQLLKDLQTIQGAARAEFLPEHPAKLDAYLIGEPLAQSRPLLEQNAQTLITRANTDRPSEVDTAFIVKVEQSRAAFVNDQGTQSTEGGRGKLSRAQRSELVKSITARRKKIQYAADTLWPSGQPSSVEARSKFRLPDDRPYSY